jgi:hypothetical protein
LVVSAGQCSVQSFSAAPFLLYVFHQQIAKQGYAVCLAQRIISKIKFFEVLKLIQQVYVIDFSEKIVRKI